MERYFFVENANYNIGDIIKISSVEHNHISKVLRMKMNDKIVCLPNNGELLEATIIGFSKNETQVKIDKIKQCETECKTNLIVYVPLLKGDKFEFLITKLTELGVKKIIPFKSQYMTAKQGNDKSQRLNQIAKDACKQCRRARIIEIGELIEFDDMLSQIENYDITIFAYENERQCNLKDLDLSKFTNVSMIVGSEGGFSEEEVEKIVNAKAQIVSLGNRILRAETAVLTLASIIQYKLGEI